MSSRSLWQEEEAHNDESCNDRRSEWPAEVPTAGAAPAYLKVAHGCTERPRENESSPEEENARDVGPQIESADDGETGCENQRTSFIAQSGAIGTTERRAQRLRESDRRPIEAFDPRVDTVLTEMVPSRRMPNTERHQQTHQERNGTSPGIADPQRSIGEIRHCSAEGRGRNDRGPIEERVKFLRKIWAITSTTRKPKKSKVPAR